MLITLVFALLGVGMLGCGKETRGNATTLIEQSFEQAPPETKKDIQVILASLKAGDFLQAAKALAPIVSAGNLTAAQKDAVGAVLKQINDAIAADPKLNTMEMFKLREQMFQATFG